MGYLAGIQNATIPESSSFATKPFVDICTIKAITDETTTKGTEYLKVVLVSKQGIEAEGTYWKPNGKDAEKDKWKLGKIKELLTHAKANLALPEDKLMPSIIGKQINCAFQSEQYVKTKGDERPVIGTKVTLRFTNPADVAFPEYVNEDYLTKKLEGTDWNILINSQKDWDKRHPGSHHAGVPQTGPVPSGVPPFGSSAAPAPQSGTDLEDDDLPF